MSVGSRRLGPPTRAILTGLVFVTVACVPPIDDEDAICPCSQGYVCNDDAGQCVPASSITDAGADDAGAPDALVPDASDAGLLDAQRLDAELDASTEVDGGSDAVKMSGRL